MIAILGKKIGMANIFDNTGSNVPVTVIEAGPCYVLQVKTKENDGYEALQVAFEEKREKLVNKPTAAKFKKAELKPMRYIKEIKVSDIGKYKVGQKIDSTVFSKGDFVDVTGTSIGRGFQGGVRRWNWKGGPSGHGSMFHRAVGSIQSGPRLSRITKGHHMPGRMGGARITTQNLEVIDVMADKNLIIVKGSVPGHENSIVIIKESIKRPKGFVKHKAAPVSAKKGAKAQVTSAARAIGKK